MLSTIKESLQGFNTFFSQLQEAIRELVVKQLERQLEAEVGQRLQRGSHARREKMSKRGTGARCQRCGSQQAQDFSRNGHRQRQLVSQYGVLNFWLPRVVCECGGSVHIPFSILEPYQRFWDDLLLQIEQWATFGLSLRQMQQAIGEQVHTPVGLRKLNEVVQDVAPIPTLEFTSIPPVIMLDAIWVDLLQATESLQTDELGRQRVVKAHTKVCILVALGLYPQSQRWGILGWELADSESQTAWERLLLPLEARGLYREHGLELFIHDGGSGLKAALEWLYPRSSHTLSTVPIILFSTCAYHRIDLHEQFFEKNGITLMLAKPFSLGSLVRALDQVFAVCQPPEYSERIIQKDAIDRAIEQEIRQQMKRDS